MTERACRLRPPLSSGADETGTAIIEFVWLAILLLVPLLYIVLAVFDVQRSAYAASAAARSATRAYVGSPGQGTAYDRALVAARLAFADQGIEAPFGLTIRCRPRPDRCLVPGSVVTAEIHTEARLPLVPDVFTAQAPSIAISARHQSPYGTFRAERP